MLGKKKFEPKLMYNLTMDDLVPEDNFYRRLDKILDLRFVYQECKSLYGQTGNPSLDPVVFFKLELVAYFENIISDRALVKKAGDMLGIRYYLGYDIDEKLPWHSTISRTRGLIKEETFEQIFEQILKMCRDAGLIDGKHQSIDSTLVKANASLDSLEIKEPHLELKEFVNRVYQENPVNENNTQQGSSEVTQNNKNDEDNKKDNKISNENLKLVKMEKEKKSSSNMDRNKKYRSRTDGDSRIATKPKTPTAMYY